MHKKRGTIRQSPDYSSLST